MNLSTNDDFIEQCANDYFNQSTVGGTPIYAVYTFERFVEMRAEGMK